MFNKNFASSFGQLGDENTVNSFLCYLKHLYGITILKHNSNLYKDIVMVKKLTFNVIRHNSNYAGPSMEIVELLLTGQDELAKKLLDWGRKTYGKDFYSNTIRFSEFCQRHNLNDGDEVEMVDTWL